MILYGTSCEGCNAIIKRWRRKARAEGLSLASPPPVIQSAACRDCGNTPLAAGEATTR